MTGVKMRTRREEAKAEEKEKRSMREEKRREGGV